MFWEPEDEDAAAMYAEMMEEARRKEEAYQARKKEILARLGLRLKDKGEVYDRVPWSDKAEVLASMGAGGPLARYLFYDPATNRYGEATCYSYREDQIAEDWVVDWYEPTPRVVLRFEDREVQVDREVFLEILNRALMAGYEENPHEVDGVDTWRCGTFWPF
jgi:hypothetical protein